MLVGCEFPCVQESTTRSSAYFIACMKSSMAVIGRVKWSSTAVLELKDVATVRKHFFSSSLKGVNDDFLSDFLIFTSLALVALTREPGPPKPQAEGKKMKHGNAHRWSYKLQQSTVAPTIWNMPHTT